jgi:hypothetical protein
MELYYILTAIAAYLLHVLVDQWRIGRNINVLACPFCRGFWIGMIIFTYGFFLVPGWSDYALLLPIFGSIISQELSNRYGT